MADDWQSRPTVARGRRTKQIPGPTASGSVLISAWGQERSSRRIRHPVRSGPQADHVGNRCLGPRRTLRGHYYWDAAIHHVSIPSLRFTSPSHSSSVPPAVSSRLGVFCHCFGDGFSGFRWFSADYLQGKAFSTAFINVDSGLSRCSLG